MILRNETYFINHLYELISCVWLSLIFRIYRIQVGVRTYDSHNDLNVMVTKNKERYTASLGHDLIQHMCVRRLIVYFACLL